MIIRATTSPTVTSVDLASTTFDVMVVRNYGAEIGAR